MKAQELIRNLRSKSNAELHEELLALRREQFSLRMQRKGVQEVLRSHNFKRIQHFIARIKTILNERVRESHS